MVTPLKVKPVAHAKPDLGRLSTRLVKVRHTTRQELEFALRDWVIDVVKVTRQPRVDGFAPEVVLMAGVAKDIDLLLQMPPSMKLGKDADKDLIHAEFAWSRAPGGRWFVSAISFAPSVAGARVQVARQRALKERLLEEAENRNAHHINLQKMVFKPSGREATWHTDSKTGGEIIGHAIERAHEHAAKDAKMLENPVTPVDMALDLAGGAVGKFGPGGGAPQLKGVEQAAEAATRAERLEHMHKMADTGKNVLDVKNVVTAEGKSTGDKVLETALNLSSYIPGAGPFIKGFAGMFFEIAIASDASRVTALRSRAYVWFVAGYIARLTLAETGSPKRAFDKKYYDLGFNAAPAVDSPGNYKAQLFLLDFASSHYTDGGWGGLSYRPEHWNFPDQYVVKWSPALLARSLATQLHTRRYLLN